MPQPASPPKSSSRRIAVWLVVGVVAAGALAAWAAWPPAPSPTNTPLTDDASPPQIAKPPTKPAPPPEPPIDTAAVRKRGWQVVAAALPRADREAQGHIDAAVKRLTRFFQERRQGSRPFAEAVLSLRGKWKFVKSRLPRAAEDEHLLFLAAQFEEHVFSAADLRREVAAVLAEYVAAARASENRLLVKLRADVSTADPLARRVLPELASDQAFRVAFDELVARVAKEASREAAIDLATFVTWQIVGQGVMQEIATKLLAAVMGRLAVTAGFATAGTTSGTVTFGLGIVVGILLDVGFDWIMRQTGHDGITRVADKVAVQVDKQGRMLVDGDPLAVQRYDTLRRLQREHSDPQISEQSKAAADSIQASGNLGLRRSLMRVHNARRQLREEALRTFFLGDEGPK